MDFIIGMIAFVLLLSVIVTIHELGHFIAAKKFGVYCGEFSIGMGPVIYKHQGKETQFSIRALPIGGFVSMAGEEDDTKKEVEVPFERTINGISATRKIIVMLAGIFMNIVLAWVIFVLIFMYTGRAVDSSSTTIGSVVEDSVAEKAGFKAGDVITSMKKENGKVIKIDSYDDVRTEINLDPQTFIFTVPRGDETLELSAKPTFNEKERAYLLGTSVQVQTKKISWYESFQYGTQKTLDNSTLIFRSLANLLQGKNLDQLSGPVGIFDVTKKAFSDDILTYIQLFAIFSLNVGIFNALPIPVLDGGRALITILEKIIGRPINQKFFEMIMYIGMLLLIALMLYATWNDVLRMF
ncbi:MAG: RIP metalloprotease RseP [Erysipelotrichia bacterium]|nr:RIP metalloprotease RseP [Erysipelotrichia bacterium]NCC54849.1 RIP metalloprotease RseP [Erysipelotrichia bacterium]